MEGEARDIRGAGGLSKRLDCCREVNRSDRLPVGEQQIVKKVVCLSGETVGADRKEWCTGKVEATVASTSIPVLMSTKLLQPSDCS